MNQNGNLQAPMNSHMGPQVAGKPDWKNGPVAGTFVFLADATRHLVNLRLPRIRDGAPGAPTGNVQHLVNTALREARLEVRRLSTLLISAQEGERRRIALDLHDGIGQSLSLLKLSIEKALRLIRQDSAREAELVLRELAPRIDEALADVRRVAMELCPPMLEDLGLLPTLSWFLREIEGASDIVLVRTISVAEHEVPRPLHLPVFRILQEALHNVTEHANAASVQVSLERTGEALRLAIEDDGRGFNEHAVSSVKRKGPGLGLLSMRERATVSGASYYLHSIPGRGTSISVVWLLNAPPAGREKYSELLM